MELAIIKFGTIPSGIKRGEYRHDYAEARTQTAIYMKRAKISEIW